MNNNLVSGGQKTNGGCEVKQWHCDCFVDDGQTASGVVFNGFCSLHAAAPELLEACKSAVNNLVNMNEPISNQDKGRRLAAISSLSIAIAKAEGRTV